MLSQHQSQMRSPPDLETENRQLNAARPRSSLQRLSVEGWSDIRISYRRDPTRAGRCLDQNILPFAVELGRQQAHSRGVGPRARDGQLGFIIPLSTTSQDYLRPRLRRRAGLRKTR